MFPLKVKSGGCYCSGYVRTIQVTEAIILLESKLGYRNLPLSPQYVVCSTQLWITSRFPPVLNCGWSLKMENTRKPLLECPRCRCQGKYHRVDVLSNPCETGFVWTFYKCTNLHSGTLTFHPSFLILTVISSVISHRVLICWLRYQLVYSTPHNIFTVKLVLVVAGLLSPV